MDTADNKFLQDEVSGFTPILFALSFVRELRKQKRICYQPSIRTALAIPKLLSARYFRTRKLKAVDYLQAAIWSTPYEDQEIAKIVANELLFPSEKKSTTKPSSVTQKSKVASGGIEGILADLADLAINLEEINSLEKVLEKEELSKKEFPAYDLMEKLLSSSEEREKSLGELIQSFGGASAMEGDGICNQEQANAWARHFLYQKLGDLSPEQVFHACKSGNGEIISRHACNPWEVTAALAGQGETTKLEEYLEDLCNEKNPSNLGKTIAFLQPHNTQGQIPLQKLRRCALKSCRDLADFVAMLKGMQEWIDPNKRIIDTSAQEDPVKALEAANWIQEYFNKSLHRKIFNSWSKNLTDLPSLERLMEILVPCKKWEQMTDEAYEKYIEEIRLDLKDNEYEYDGIPSKLESSIQLAAQMWHQGNSFTGSLAGLMTTDILCLVPNEDLFLSLLDAYIAHGVTPSDLPRLLDHGTSLGISEDAIHDRLGKPLEQLVALIVSGTQNHERYAMLAEKIPSIPWETLEKLACQVCQDHNLEGMAVLVSIDLGGVCDLCDDQEFIIASICFKGIGSGTNLLKQWYCHHDRIDGNLRCRIKEIAKKALLEISLDWSKRGSGSCEEGIIPQNEIRPFKASDDLELLDIENTVEAVISEGKGLEQIRHDDLFVHDTSRGRAAMGVLIDISGSMSGGDLAICSIAVVMVLQRLQTDEIAIAFFEGDTHVLKTFEEDRSIDEVADEILELKARGGTCADQAMKWITEQFLQSNNTDFRLLFLLSDFCFVESDEEMERYAVGLADLEVKYLGVSHVHYNKQMNEIFWNTLGGDFIRVPSIGELPTLLIRAISNL